jgi:hypothetical protein
LFAVPFPASSSFLFVFRCHSLPSLATLSPLTVHIHPLSMASYSIEKLSQMAKDKNFYNRLGVPVYSDVATLTRSYRLLAKVAHPDRAKDLPEFIVCCQRNHPNELHSAPCLTVSPLHNSSRPSQKHTQCSRFQATRRSTTSVFTTAQCSTSQSMPTRPNPSLLTLPLLFRKIEYVLWSARQQMQRTVQCLIRPDGGCVVEWYCNGEALRSAAAKACSCCFSSRRRLCIGVIHSDLR